MWSHRNHFENYEWRLWTCFHQFSNRQPWMWRQNIYLISDVERGFVQPKDSTKFRRIELKYKKRTDRQKFSYLRHLSLPQDVTIMRNDIGLKCIGKRVFMAFNTEDRKRDSLPPASLSNVSSNPSVTPCFLVKLLHTSILIWTFCPTVI